MSPNIFSEKRLYKVYILYKIQSSNINIHEDMKVSRFINININIKVKVTKLLSAMRPNKVCILWKMQSSSSYSFFWNASNSVR